MLREWPVEERGIYAIYPTRQHLSGKVRALVNYLADVFKGLHGTACERVGKSRCIFLAKDNQFSYI